MGGLTFLGPNAITPRMGVPRVVYIFLLLLLVAASVWVVTAIRFQNPAPPVGMGIGAAIAIVGFQLAPVRRAALRGFRWMQELSRTQRNAFALGLFAAGCLVLPAIEVLADRPFEMMWHDEFQFHLQSQFVARGTLWLPPHPLGEFFDTFYVLTTPKYAPQSFPGAAIIYVPTAWFSLPTWVMPVIVSAIACALVWRVLAEVCGPGLAMVGWVVLLSLPGFERISTMYLAQIPVLLLCLGAVLAAMRFCKTRGLGAAALMGGLLGWAAITRPLDAACWGVIVVAMLLPLVRTTRVARLGAAALIVVAAAVPFLGVQMVFNKAITGSLIHTPFDFYNQRDQPALAFGGGEASRRLPQSDIPQKQMFYQSFTMKWVKLDQHPKMTWRLKWQNRLNILQSSLGGSVWMIPAALIGILALRTRARLLVFAILPLFVLSYTAYPIFLSHYMTFALPGWVLLYSLAPLAIGLAVAERRRMAVTCGSAIAIMGMAVGASAQRAGLESPDYVLRLLRDTNKTLAQVQAPAIVLFTSPPGGEALHIEHVYNDDVAWPDDAPIIKAHDRGDENIRLYQYYAERQPDRTVWRFDRKTGELTRLGNVRELASAAATP